MIIEGFVAGFVYWYYYAKALWRAINGRWYIWRDCPTWVVRIAAHRYEWGKHNPKLSDVNKHVLSQALMELCLRQSIQSMKSQRRKQPWSAFR